MRLLRTATGFFATRFAAIFRDFAGEDDFEGAGRRRAFERAFGMGSSTGRQRAVL